LYNNFDFATKDSVIASLSLITMLKRETHEISALWLVNFNRY